MALTKNEMLAAVGERHNPPVVHNQKEANAFQAEIQDLYDKLIAALTPYGEEGDYYGVSDYAIRPCLGNYGRVSRPAPHLREFTITIISEKFFRSPWLELLHQFLRTHAPDYRIWSDQEFDPQWNQTIILTADMVRVYCDKPDELQKACQILAEL